MWVFWWKVTKEFGWKIDRRVMIQGSSQDSVLSFGWDSMSTSREIEDDEWCDMDEKARSQCKQFRALSLRFGSRLKMDGRSIYTHFWTCIDNCLIC